MLRRIRKGRHAGVIYFAVACILAASLLMFRLRRPPVVIIEAAAGALAVAAQDGGSQIWQSADVSSEAKSTDEAATRPLEILDDAPAVKELITTDLGDDASQERLIYVHVTGQVAKPGLYRLPYGSRVHQAIEAAGGMTSKADRDSVNIALPVGDGQQVYIPAVKMSAPASNPSKGVVAVAAEAKQEPKTEEITDGAQTAVAPEPQGRLDVTADKPEQAGADSAAEGALLKIDINAASQAELEQLPGIGPSTALKIIEYREEHGPFTTIEALMDVSGIGPAKFAAMKDMVVIR